MILALLAHSTLCAAAGNLAPAATGCPLQVEAVRSDWQAQHPPADGWTPVKLPDFWSSRWPQFDGVVWYRATWSGRCAAERPLALFLDSMNMAGAVYLNGSLIGADDRLSEPLSRSWNVPRYWLLPAPLLRDDTNTILVRLSGFAAYQGGLGTMTVGTPTTVAPRYVHARRVRRDIQLFSLAVTSTLGCFFLALWLMRRQETVYGWFTLQSATWWCFGYNQIATSPWPLSSTNAWEAIQSIAFILYSACFTMFIMRFSERRRPRLEIALWALSACQILAMLAAPHGFLADVRSIVAVIPVITFIATCVVFVVHSLKTRRGDQIALSGCLVVFVAAGIHDLLDFLGILDDNVYYSPVTAQIQMISMALVLASRFVFNLRKIESFNDQLTESIATANEELRVTLHRQHELELANARLNERLNLAHDLHDGLGSTLVSSITTLEHSPHGVPPTRFLDILKELRDDLRIIIDAASIHHAESRSLVEMIAPLRHRLTHSLEAKQINCQWRFSNVDDLQLPNTVSLGILRILQEGLTNVLQHSDADRAEIDIERVGPVMRLSIRDNGHGFDPSAIDTHHGTGMRSMRARASKLGGTFFLTSGTEGTLLQIDIAGIAIDFRASQSRI